MVTSVIVTSLVCSHPVQIQGNIAINLWRVSDPPQTTTTSSTPSMHSSEAAESVSSSDAIVERADAPMAIQHERPMDTEAKAINDIPRRIERTSDSIVHHEVQQQENSDHKEIKSEVSGDHILAMHSEAVMHHETKIDNQEIPVQAHDQADAELAVETKKNGEELRGDQIMKMDSADAQAEREPLHKNFDTEHIEKLISDQSDNLTMEANEKHREGSKKSEADGLTVEVKETPKTESQKVSGDHILAMHSEAVMHHETRIENQEIPVQSHDQSDAELAVETMKNGEELRGGKMMKTDSANAQAEREPLHDNFDTEHIEKLISDQSDNLTMEANEKHREESEKPEADGLTVELQETPKTEEIMLHHHNSDPSLLSESTVITVAQISAEPQTQAEIIVSAALITSTDVAPNVETFSTAPTTDRKCQERSTTPESPFRTTTRTVTATPGEHGNTGKQG